MLNEKRTRFCQEYLIDLNVAAAARRAGFSEVSAKQHGYDLMQDPEVIDLIGKLMEERQQRTQITADMVVMELAKIGFSNIQDYLTEENSISDLTTLDKDKAAAVSSIEITETEWEGGKRTNTKFKLHSKIAALENLGKHLGIYEKDNRQKGDNKEAPHTVTLPDGTKIEL